MKNLSILFIILFGILMPHSGFSQQQVAADSQQGSVSTNATLQASRDSASFNYEKAHNTGSLSDFPRLHPMIVHFPIVFILLAFAVQLFSFFVFKRELSWVSLVLTALGFVGSVLASKLFHGGDPMLSSLDPIARATFEKHEHYAELTEVFSGIAAIVKIISHFVFKRSLWTGLIATILMGCAVYAIHTTGEMGARLVHIDAIGVQGNKIPLKDDD